MRRQIALEIAAPLAQSPIDALADAAVLGRTAIGNPQAALNPSARQTYINSRTSALLPGFLCR